MTDFTIGRRQLYILPTRIGWYFALIIVALFAIAIKFDNQPAFMMLFLLVSISIITMHYTHNNVIGISITAQPTQPIYAGDMASFPVKIVNNGLRNCQALWLTCNKFRHLFDIKSKSTEEITVEMPSSHRGYLNCDPICITSQFPIGIFFCWTKQFKSSQRCLVYPRPLDLIPLPEASMSSSDEKLSATLPSSNEDMNGLRPYAEGDRLRDIHWPSLAKTNKLVTIEHESQSSNTLNISWFNLPSQLSTEEKLSQLCYWLQSAEKNNARYQLEMPNQSIDYDNGQTHLNKCLKVLALWELKDI